MNFRNSYLELPNLGLTFFSLYVMNVDISMKLWYLKYSINLSLNAFVQPVQLEFTTTESII